MFSAIFLFAVSLTVLLVGSNFFIASSERVGLSFGISPFVIGVAILAIGTSLPELITSIISVQAGSSEIVVGNVVGSNITNILLVIGITGVMAKNIELENDIMETIYPLLLGSSFLLWFALSDYQFNWVETGIFLAGMILFLVYLTKDDEQQSVEKKPARVKDYVTILLSIIAIYFGANYTIDGLVKISSQLGVNPAVVSITVLALGTSLPEIVVCISASRRGLNSMAVGNIIGSNIFNTYAVMAVPSLFGNLNIPGRISDFSLPFMIVVTILFGVVCVNKRITIWEALMLLGFYIFFTAELIRLGFVN